MKPMMAGEIGSYYHTPREQGKSMSQALLSYAAINNWLPYMGSPRRRDSLPQEEQLRKIVVAQQKRERKALKKGEVK